MVQIEETCTVCLLLLWLLFLQKLRRMVEIIRPFTGYLKFVTASSKWLSYFLYIPEGVIMLSYSIKSPFTFEGDEDIGRTIFADFRTS